MAFQDINSNHMTPADVTLTLSLMGQLEAVLQPYLRNLSEAENDQYGTIDEQAKLFVNKANDLHITQPALQSPDVDWTEFDADFESRFQLSSFAMRLQALVNALTETRRTHDYDNYQNALIDYAYAQYKDRTEPGLGYDSKVAELGQFFEHGTP